MSITSTAEKEQILEERLGHCFVDKSLFWHALTHRSFSHEQGFFGNYERLEFLGDAVLGLLTSDWLFQRFPDLPEGELTKLKSFLVSAGVLGDFAERIELGTFLRLGVGEDRSGGRRKVSILADAVEALLAAVYIDGGLAAAKAVVEPILEHAYEARARLNQTDAKTRLQEVAQARGLGLPAYQLIEEQGPDHDKNFTVECWLAGELVGRDQGKSKKVAEQGAARAALARYDAASPA